LATHHSSWGADWNVAWLVEVRSDKKNIVSELVPKGFESLPYSKKSITKNYPLRNEVFNKLFSSESFNDKYFDIYVGGPEGNFFVVISKDKKQVIYYRFKT
jgi:hypothetical protein